MRCHLTEFFDVFSYFCTVFDNDLVALHNQLEELSEDSGKLQAKYPGPNATHISEQLAVVRNNWDNLQERAKAHKHTLRSNYQLQLFGLSCQDLVSWCSHLKIMLISEEKVSNVAEAQRLKVELCTASVPRSSSKYHCSDKTGTS